MIIVGLISFFMGSVPLTFRGGTVLIDEFQNRKIAVCGGDVFRLTRTVWKSSRDSDLPDDQIANMIKEFFNVDDVVVVGKENFMSKHILIVGAQPNIILPLKYLMEQTGYSVGIALSGEEALESISGYKPDLVLLDINLPGIDDYNRSQGFDKPDIRKGFNLSQEFIIPVFSCIEMGGVMIKSILVPVDGSEHSGKALTLAVDIAEKYDANLSVLFVASRKIDEGLRHYTTHEYNYKDDSEISEEIGKSTINRMINKLKTKVVIKPVVLFGDPAGQIVEYSMNKNFDMVVMGNRGLSDIKGMMMGSVSRKVNRQVKCAFVSVK